MAVTNLTVLENVQPTLSGWTEIPVF